jgi:hypothetical protein
MTHADVVGMNDHDTIVRRKAQFLQCQIHRFNILHILGGTPSVPGAVTWPEWSMFELTTCRFAGRPELIAANPRMQFETSARGLVDSTKNGS